MQAAAGKDGNVDCLGVFHRKNEAIAVILVQKRSCAPLCASGDLDISVISDSKILIGSTLKRNLSVAYVYYSLMRLKKRLL
jgi:hypothetical protein